jgi:polo-like kinase 1
MTSTKGFSSTKDFMSTGTNFKSTSKNEVYVKKWVDYSSKYGLGYLMSNGMVGVFFNDSTKIVLDANGK